MSSRISKLVDGMTSREIRSPYLDNLQTRAAARQGKGGIEAVQAEILREMADSYSRAQRRVDAEFGALRRLEEQLGEVTEGKRSGAKREIIRLTKAFNEQRSVAERRLWELRVHREALGFSNNDKLRRDYPLPPKKPVPRD